MEDQPLDKPKRTELNLETLTKAVPLIVGFFICCGSLYLSTYYNCFHINIFNYLDTSEILVTFLYLIQDIAYFFAVFVAYVIFAKFLLLLISKYSKSKAETEHKMNVFYHSDNVSYGMIVISLIFCVGYIIKSYLTVIDSNYIIKNKDWMGSALLIYTYVAALWITAQLEGKTKSGIKNAIIFFSLFFLSYSVSKALDRIEATVNDVDSGSMVIVGKDTINTTPTYMYVGRTNNYVFLFDKKKKIADVIPCAKIDKLSFRYQKP